MIEAKGLKLSYGELEVLKGINLKISKGDFVSIVGSSGAGKTTLLNVIGSLEKPDIGILKINNQHIYNLKDKQLSRFRNQELGFVFQFHNLLAEFSSLENVCIPAYIKGARKKDVEKRANYLLDMLKISDKAKSMPDQLSGGEKQRVAVARALINNPSIVIADEPSGNLDSTNSKILHDILYDINLNLKQTIIVATHDKNLAEMAKQQLVIKDGVII